MNTQVPIKKVSYFAFNISEFSQSLEIELSNEIFCGIWGMEEKEELCLLDFGSKILAIFRIKYKLSKENISGRWRMEEEEEWGLLDEPRARDVRRKVHWAQFRSRW